MKTKINIIDLPDDILNIILKKYCSNYRYLATVCKRFMYIILKTNWLYEKFYNPYFKNRIYELTADIEMISLISRIRENYDVIFYRREKPYCLMSYKSPQEEVIIAKRLCMIKCQNKHILIQLFDKLVDDYYEKTKHPEFIDVGLTMLRVPFISRQALFTKVNSNKLNLYCITDEFPFIKCAYLALYYDNMELFIYIFKKASQIIINRCHTYKLMDNTGSFIFDKKKILSAFPLPRRNAQWINTLTGDSRTNELTQLMFSSSLYRLFRFVADRNYMLIQSIQSIEIFNMFTCIIDTHQIIPPSYKYLYYYNTIRDVDNNKQYYTLNDFEVGAVSISQFYSNYENVIKLGYDYQNKDIKIFLSRISNCNMDQLHRSIFLRQIYPKIVLDLLIYYRNGRNLIINDISYRTITAVYEVVNEVYVNPTCVVHKDVSFILPILINEYEHLSQNNGLIQIQILLRQRFSAIQIILIHVFFQGIQRNFTYTRKMKPLTIRKIMYNYVDHNKSYNISEMFTKQMIIFFLIPCGNLHDWVINLYTYLHCLYEYMEYNSNLIKRVYKIFGYIRVYVSVNSRLLLSVNSRLLLSVNSRLLLSVNSGLSISTYINYVKKLAELTFLALFLIEYIIILIIYIGM